MLNRKVLAFLGCMLVGFIALSAASIFTKINKPQKKTYTIIAIPDTQFYSEEKDLTPIFAKQIEWVLDNIREENIVFVTHLGDVVDNADDQEQWDNTLSALEPLFNAPDSLPYSICQGQS